MANASISSQKVSTISKLGRGEIPAGFGTSNQASIRVGRVRRLVIECSDALDEMAPIVSRARAYSPRSNRLPAPTGNPVPEYLNSRLHRSRRYAIFWPECQA